MNKSTLLIVILALSPAVASASHQDIQYLASELEHASYDLARSAKSVRGFSSVSNNANRLRTQAKQLADAIVRGRTSSYVRTQFNDVTRYYERLEISFIRARDSYGTPYVDRSFDQVAGIYDSLRFEFYGDTYNEGYRYSPSPYPPTYYDRGPNNSSPIILINPSRGYGGRNPRAPVILRKDNRRDDFDHRSLVIDRQNQRDNDRSNNNNRNNPGRGNRNDRDNRDNTDTNRLNRDRNGPAIENQNQRNNGRADDRNSNSRGSTNNRAERRRQSPVTHRQEQRNNEPRVNSSTSDPRSSRATPNTQRNNPVTQGRNEVAPSTQRVNPIIQRQTQRGSDRSTSIGRRGLQTRNN